MRLEGVHFRLFRGGVLRADGTTSTLSYQRESTAVEASAMELRIHEGREPVLVTAPHGEGTISARTFEASGGLHAVRGEDTARTRSARFVPGSQGGGHVVGDEPVFLAGRGYRMQGNGFSLDTSTGEIALRGGTRLVAGIGGRR